MVLAMFQHNYMTGGELQASPSLTYSQSFRESEATDVTLLCRLYGVDHLRGIGGTAGGSSGRGN